MLRRIIQVFTSPTRFRDIFDYPSQKTNISRDSERLKRRFPPNLFIPKTQLARLPNQCFRYDGSLRVSLGELRKLVSLNNLKVNIAFGSLSGIFYLPRVSLRPANSGNL